MANVTSKVAKSAGTAVPAETVKSNSRKGRKPVEPGARAVAVRGIRRASLETLLAALDGSTDAIATLFGTVPPAEPVKPEMPENPDNDALMAHIAALNEYSEQRAAYPAALDAFRSATADRTAIRNAVWSALNDIPMRKPRKVASK